MSYLLLQITDQKGWVFVMENIGCCSGVVKNHGKLKQAGEITVFNVYLLN